MTGAVFLWMGDRGEQIPTAPGISEETSSLDTSAFVESNPRKTRVPAISQGLTALF
jgi:hypothetical protein